MKVKLLLIIKNQLLKIILNPLRIHKILYTVSIYQLQKKMKIKKNPFLTLQTEPVSSQQG